ncbi:MAG: PQQ-like beta-propeller repeat protein [Candidatus Hydrogenedentes bacterium]|nr:PQQ-like beta-propeller repeat protein [Candidatus Hydrogenedentota bacterium]
MKSHTMNRRTFLAAAGAAGLAAAASPSDGAAQSAPVRADWPHFLGPARTGVSAETGLLKTWPEEGPPVVWQRDIGEGYGAPVVAEGRLVNFHRIGDEEIVECVDALDGAKSLWQYGYPTRYVDQYGYNGGPRSSPAIAGGRVYTYGAEGVLTCVDFATGALRWQRPVNREFNAPQGFFGAGSAPVVDGGLVFLNTGGPDGAGVAAFDADTGETAWTASNDTASYSTPIVAALHGERLAIFHTGDGLLVVEAKTGMERYRYPFRSELYESAIAATPVLVGDVVFLSGAYHIGAVALKLAPGGLEVVWRDEFAMQNHWATSIYHEGYLYGMDGRHERGSNLRCIEFATGKVVWTAEKGLGRASFIMVEGHLIAVGERGDIALIEASPEGYREKARVKVLYYPVWTPPILARGRLYVRNERSKRAIKCLDLRAEA